MESLPTEILREIVGYLPEKDLNSVRLVNHKLSAAANVYKYRILRVCANREGLSHLLYVSEKPELARCVREMYYPWNLLPAKNDPFPSDVFENDLEDFMATDGPIDPAEIATLIHLASVFLEWYQ
ncbi:hypothetical protein RUND412_002077 [Rhizina undulata]